MEHRNDLEDILLNGLPENERQQVVSTMRRVTSERLRILQSEGLRSNTPVPGLYADDSRP